MQNKFAAYAGKTIGKVLGLGIRGKIGEKPGSEKYSGVRTGLTRRNNKKKPSENQEKTPEIRSA
ncbi:hypothetical protein ACJ7K1_02665 [Paenibacillus elgii]